MKYTDLLNNLKNTHWINVTETNEYFATEDISLRFKLYKSTPIDSKTMQENMRSVLNQLKDKCVFHSVEISKVDFEYENKKIASLDLFKFICSEQYQDDVPVNIYFAKQDTLQETQLVENPFYISLIKYFNTDHTLNYLHYATGQKF
ncbi:MAG TPA: hypothetical protein DEF26_09930 [Acinetobacter sp.]|nr:hypothetical protein [Acinetobacter sp.]